MMSTANIYHSLIFLIGLMNMVSLSLQDISQPLQINHFKTDGSCASLTTNSGEDLFSPYITQARSNLGCATLCAKSAWCTSYSFTKVKLNSINSTEGADNKCLLSFTEDSQCLETSGLSSKVSAFLKSNNENEANSGHQFCEIKRENVLKKSFSQISELIDHIYLTKLFIIGSDTKVQYTINSVNYITKTRSFTFESDTSRSVCIETDHILLTTASKSPLYVRSYCSNGAVTVHNYNSISSSGIQNPNQFVWIVNTGSGSRLRNKRVFSSGSGTSDLVAAVKGGQILKLFIKSSARTVDADIIFEYKINGIVISQAMYLDSRKYNILSVPLTGSLSLLSWHILTGNIDKKTIDSEVEWFSDSCWEHVHTSSTSTSFITITKLLTAIKSGKKVRVSFDVDGRTIYATPVYLGIENTDTAVAHVTNVLKQNTLLGNLLQSSPALQHFIITSASHVTEISVKIGSASYTSSAVSEEIRWFVEVQNYTLVHQTALALPSSTASLAKLVANVMDGCDIRVKIYSPDSGDLHFFTCGLLEINSNADEVTCHIHGQLAVDFTGGRSSTTPPSSSTGLLGSIIGGLTGTGGSSSSPELLSSGCPQNLVVSTSGTLLTYISCLDMDNLEEPVMTESISVEWFVA